MRLERYAGLLLNYTVATALTDSLIPFSQNCFVINIHILSEILYILMLGQDVKSSEPL